MPLSIVEYIGPSEHNSCGYCRSRKRAESQESVDHEGKKQSQSAITDEDEGGDSCSFGAIAHVLFPDDEMALLDRGWDSELDNKYCVQPAPPEIQFADGPEPSRRAWGHCVLPSDYQILLDRGWRRSGRYLYKPTMERTCCPQYTIRLDVHKFRLSRTQRRVLRHMNDYLQKDQKPRSAVKEEASRIDNEVATAPSTAEVNAAASKQPPSKKERLEGVDAPIKKKVLRRERAIARWIAKGLDPNLMQAARRQKEAARRRTLASFIQEYEPSWKHRLTVELVPITSEAFKQRATETYELYEKYQQTIHHDKRSTVGSFERFLSNSPLIEDPKDSTQPHFGSYHQQYVLDGKLIAVGVVDVLPKCYSSKYLFYDPDYAFLSLGTYTALREIAFVQTELAPGRPDLHYYYMGYYIDTCPKMRYKGKFEPSDLLCERTFKWRPLSECLSILAANQGKFTEWYPDEERAAKLLVKKVPVYSDKKVYEWNFFRVLKPAAVNTQVLDKLNQWVEHVGPDANRLVLYLSELQQLNDEGSGEADSDAAEEDSDSD